MSLSKCRRSQSWEPEVPSWDTRSGECLISRVSSRLNPHRLREFARLLGIHSDEAFYNLEEKARQTGQDLSVTVSSIQQKVPLRIRCLSILHAFFMMRFCKTQAECITTAAQ